MKVLITTDDNISWLFEVHGYQGYMGFNEPGSQIGTGYGDNDFIQVGEKAMLDTQAGQYIVGRKVEINHGKHRVKHETAKDDLSSEMTYEEWLDKQQNRYEEWLEKRGSEK
jgi:hypothetical protein